MSPADILLAAADLIATGRGSHGGYSCLAIQRVIERAEGAYHSVFSKGFRNHPAAQAYAVLLGRLPDTPDFENETTPEGKNERLLALCMAATLAGDCEYRTYTQSEPARG